MNMNRNTRVLLLSFVLAVAVLLAGCELLNPVSGSGTLVRSVYPAAGFTGIQASNAFVVRVIPDTAYSVTVTSDDNLHRYLVVENNAPGVLRLGLIPGYAY